MRRALVVAAVALGWGCGGPPGGDRGAESGAAPPPPPALLWNGDLGVQLGRDGTWDGRRPMVVDLWGGDAPERLIPVGRRLVVRLYCDGRRLVPDRPDRVERTYDARSPLTDSPLRLPSVRTLWRTREGDEVEIFACTTRDGGRLTLLVALRPAGGLGALEVEAGFEPDRRGSTEAALESVRLPDGRSLFAMGDARPRDGLRDPVQARLRSGPSERPRAGPSPGTRTAAVGFRFARIDLWLWPRPAGYRSEAEASIHIDGPEEDGRAVASFLRHLQASIPSVRGHPVSPFGLSNERYGGRQFWDADAWVFPALAFLDPELARAVPDHRAATFAQARRNYRLWVERGRPLRDGPLPSPVGPAPAGGAMFPWESARRGTEQAPGGPNDPGETRWQHHVTGTAAFWFDRAAALGLADPALADEVVRGAARFCLARLSALGNGKVGVRRTMSPDEFQVSADNDLYTNLVAAWCVRRAGLSLPGRLARPRDSGGPLAYDGDTRRVYKQAAAILAVWPLQDPEAESEAGLFLERFAGRSTPNGPAMSEAIEALVRARHGDVDQAYREWRRSWEPYTRNPGLLFSEAPNGKETYFTTGAAGSLNAVLYGFLGLRIDESEPEGVPWKRPLRRGYWFSLNPRLPRVWRSVRVCGLAVLGQRLDVRASHGGLTVEPLPLE